MNTSKTLGNYTKTTLGTAGALTAATQADAAIVYFDVNPDQTLSVGQSVSFGNIDVVSETYTLGSTAGAYFGLNLFSNESRYAIFNGNVYQTIEWGYVGEGSGVKLASNTSISGASPWGWSGYGVGLAVDNVNYWGYGGSGFTALRIVLGGGNYNYGWAEFSYTPNGASTSATITGFAFEGLANTAILAGDTGGGPVPVPEPGQVAASLLLLAGIAGYFALRRRAGAASEPTGLHALALGARGIEEFRKNKAE